VSRGGRLLTSWCTSWNDTCAAKFHHAWHSSATLTTATSRLVPLDTLSHAWHSWYAPPNKCDFGESATPRLGYTLKTSNMILCRRKWDDFQTVSTLKYQFSFISTPGKGISTPRNRYRLHWEFFFLNKWCIFLKWAST